MPSSIHTTRRPGPPQILVVGKSRAVLDGAEQILRARGFGASSTNRFDDVLRDFDVAVFDLVVFGGQVPADLEANLTAEIDQRQPRMVYVKGMSGIPGLIADQVSGAFAGECPKLLAGPSYNDDPRSVEMSLELPADVKVTVWWVTSFVPPDPISTSRLVSTHIARWTPRRARPSRHSRQGRVRQRGDRPLGHHHRPWLTLTRVCIRPTRRCGATLTSRSRADGGARTSPPRHRPATGNGSAVPTAPLKRRE